MFFFYFLLLVSVVSASHYRGGSISYTIPSTANDTNRMNQVAVRITQRHSWRRSSHYCNDTSSTANTTIGEGRLEMYAMNGSISGAYFNPIDALVKCTDYSEAFDYSVGEISHTVFLPTNSLIEYRYKGCCWITLLSPDTESDWSLPLLINTSRRADGSLNNSPKTAMNPIVQVEVGKMHRIRVPMADSDGDRVRCRWGNGTDECGVICFPKGSLTSDPCEFTYNASKLGYHAVALIMEDFDSNDNVLSSVPLQFLIHIVEASNETDQCPDPPVYFGEWTADSCIGVQSNVTYRASIRMRIPCANTSTTLMNILTVSPMGLQRGNIQLDPNDPQIYTMPIEWIPTQDQYGIQQLCVTPVDSLHRTGVQTCVTFQVDILPPEFIRFSPSGLVSATQSEWIVRVDRDIVRPRRPHGVYIHFVKRSNDQTVYSIDAAKDTSVVYGKREITFSTGGFLWEAGEEYYILFDSGIATINESCGVESLALHNSSVWIFRIAPLERTTEENSIITETVSNTRPVVTTSRAMPRPVCPRWLSFRTVSNESTDANRSQVIFCFQVEADVADVTIAANTGVTCPMWKLSGMADPLIELYTWPADQLLAQNDDGNSLTFQNCYASVISYRLTRGEYRVVIRHPKCAYGRFELRLSAEIERNLK